MFYYSNVISFFTLFPLYFQIAQNAFENAGPNLAGDQASSNYMAYCDIFCVKNACLVFVAGADHHSCCGIGDLSISDRCADHREPSDRVSIRGSVHRGWTYILRAVRPLRYCTIFHGYV